MKYSSAGEEADKLTKEVDLQKNSRLPYSSVVMVMYSYPM